MKQKVYSVSYLAKAEFEFKNGVYNLVAIPSGAEVVKVSLEVVGTPTSGTVSVGFKDETTKNYFLTLENTQTNKNATSAKDYTATSNQVVVAEVKSANAISVKGVLRVLYFLPSVIEVEY
ncbi:hypothetical protein [Helicobacter phage COL 5-PUJ]|uniref:hypothetical protein n=1 Tax=Helicobacter pylori TaxID=210 RepID=UPI001931775D|nr:hypothetical protein [Helicobacter pylori]MBS3010866.1 hypothetical protein [Helicobacter pylori]MBS3016755.1 hypothetical protein [Helicobacter pylori]QQO40054.1 hypothetical protein [Helicobacter phage COL 5-PUJ]QQO40085.1 hypothetical protein [Helicobacter phage COL 6-PUJ]